MLVIYRIIAGLVGLGFSQLLMEKYVGYLYVYINGEMSQNIVPIWVFVIPGLLGAAFATRGWQDRQRNMERSFPWFVIGMLLNASSWVLTNSEVQFKIVAVLTPIFVWYVIKNRKLFFNSKEERFEAAKNRVVN